MPKIKVEKIVSFSSEDPAFPASNLLIADPSKKWKCNTKGESSVSAVLQLEQAFKISAVDIGNEHSAYIEVLVSRSSNGSIQDFKPLLATSSFMSALDSRQSTNVNKVRMFTHDQLSKAESDQKWDRVKLVCTQPFNKHVQYGISFVAFHTTEQITEQPAKQLGKFALRPESPQEFAVGSLFSQRKEPPLTGAAAIRQAANSPISLQPKTPLLEKLRQSKEGSPSTSTSRLNDPDNEAEAPKKRNRLDLLYNEDEEGTNEKIDKLIENKLLEKEKLEAEEKEKAAAKLEKAKREKALNDIIKKAKTESETTKPAADKADKDSKLNTTPNKLHNNTDKPKKMDDTSNNKRKAADAAPTPKKKPKLQRKPFHLLLEGVVVVVSGIQNPERANLRSKALSMGARYKGDWDSNCTHLICAFVNTPKFTQVQGRGKIVTKNWLLDCHKQRKRLPWRKYALDRNDNAPPSEEEILEDDGHLSEDSEDDSKSSKPSTSSTANDNNLPSTSKASTANSTDLPKLPNFFSKKYFYVDENLSDNDKKLLTKYITAYNGIILDDLYESKIVITSIENVITMQSKCPNDMEFISSDWIWECHNQQKCVSPDDFLML